MADTLIELAERCEKATGPDRELDVAIGLTGRFYIAEPRYPGAKPMIGYVDDEGCRVEPGNGAQDRLVPRYTASLDAVLTLTPEGLHISHLGEARYMTRSPAFFAQLEAWTSADGVDRSERRAIGVAATLPLALCAAALRARAAMEVKA